MAQNPYKLLAERLDALPNGFPATPDGAELRLLEKLFSPDEAALAAELRLTPESAAQIAERLSQSGWQGVDVDELQNTLKSMARKGLISASRIESGLGFGLMPFVVGIYEAQIGRIDAELVVAVVVANVVELRSVGLGRRPGESPARIGVGLELDFLNESLRHRERLLDRERIGALRSRIRKSRQHPAETDAHDHDEHHQLDQREAAPRMPRTLSRHGR